MPLNRHDVVHSKLSWAYRYTLDWGACDGTVTAQRIYSTAWRWYPNPRHRQNQLIYFRSWAGDTFADFEGNHLRNINDLMDLPALLDPGYNPALFGAFILGLRGGDVIDGGRVYLPFLRGLAKYAPGLAWTYQLWMQVFEAEPFPWNIYAWPQLRAVTVEA